MGKTKKKVVRTRRRERKNVAIGTAHIQSTFNNTIISIADLEGNVISWGSAGAQGFKGSRKSTPFAAQVTAEATAKKALEHGMRSIEVFVRGPGAGREAELTMDAGPDAGHSHRAGDRALRLGRSPDNDIILRDPATSGHHARVERRGDTFWIVDLGSTNGTLVNGEPIQEKELNHDDRITIGQNAVHFSVLGS